MQRNPITLEFLETLDAIDRRGSFAKAAEEQNKATSAISYAIQKQEEQLNVVLFQRKGRRSVLTPAGQLILTEGRHLLLSAARLASQAKEVATGWETRIRIAVESLHNYPEFFTALATFSQEHASIELDIKECVLNGGWEALDHDHVDLVIGAPGPVPQQKGYRAITMGQTDLVPVIAADHPHAQAVSTGGAAGEKLSKVQRIVIHDTSASDIPRTAGLAGEGKTLYVQNIEQKQLAILAGLGVGHLPRHRVENLLQGGTLLEVQLGEVSNPEQFIAWKTSSKGKGLQALTRLLTET